MSVPVISITINEGDQTILANSQFQFTTTLEPTDATNQVVNWNSSNPTAATVDLSGNVTALTEGLTIVTASALDNPAIESSVQVTVKIIPVESITLTPFSAPLLVNQTLQLMATIEPQDASDKSFTFYCTNPLAASVTQDGVVTGLAPGLAIINAYTPNNKITNSMIYVQEIPVESVSLNETTLVFHLGDRATLQATVLPADATNKSIVWFSSNTQIATVDKDGNVTAIGFGSASITGRAQDKSASANVFVNPTQSQESYTFTDTINIEMTSITLNTSSFTLNIGQSEQFQATTEPSDVSNNTLLWYSSDSTLVTIDSAGTFTAINPGTVTITVTDITGKVSAQAFVTVSS
jgi:uncharacterized protein YjdB